VTEADTALVANGPPAPAIAEQPLRAVHTPNFPGLLRRLGASLLVTTYQAGKPVMVRDEGDHLNTHFRSFPAPMGKTISVREDNWCQFILAGRQLVSVHFGRKMN
jgi:hypothetical protein